MKSKKIISIYELDNKTAQLFASYCFLLKNKLSDDWYFTKKQLPNIMAVPSNYKGEIPKETQYLLKVGSHSDFVKFDNSNSLTIINITAPFSSHEIISKLNMISSKVVKKAEETIKTKNPFSFKKSISKLFHKYIQSKPDKIPLNSHHKIKNNKTHALLKLVDKNFEKNLKVVFLGRPGAGKTTAIESASTSNLVKCEVNATDTVGLLKNQTTIGIDYCECQFKNGINLKLFGTPGQGRYSQLQTQTVKNADISIILIDLTSVAPFSEFKYYNNILNSVNTHSLKIVLFTHCDQNEHDIKGLSKAIIRAAKGDVITAKVDPRNGDEVRGFLKLIAQNIVNKNKEKPQLESYSV